MSRALTRARLILIARPTLYVTVRVYILCVSMSVRVGHRVSVSVRYVCVCVCAVQSGACTV